ncbi:hypothetical protein [Psychrobacter sp. TWR1-1-1]|uniref:hypothetical protein n=1 Tax=Psychrobacter sp. TWR1-1-1 TaxID=2804665 RepID=UPI003CF52E1B
MICKKGCDPLAAIVALPPAGCQLVSISGVSGVVGGLGALVLPSLLELFESSEPPQAVSSSAILTLSSVLRMMGSDVYSEEFDMVDEFDRKNMG